MTERCVHPAAHVGITPEVLAGGSHPIRSEGGVKGSEADL